MSAKTIQFTIKNPSTDRVPDKSYAGSELNRSISGLVLILCLPFILVNTLLAIVTKKPVLELVRKKDCLGRVVEYCHFTCGVMKNIAVLGAIFRKRISLCGMPLDIELTNEQRIELLGYSHIPAGLVDAINVRQSGGLSMVNKVVLLKKQFTGTRTDYLALLLKGVISQFVFKGQNASLNSPATFNIFGLKINNVSMDEAVRWVMAAPGKTSKKQHCKVGCFVNVNSVNLIHQLPQLKVHLNQADQCFVDGSGMRIAAKKIGIQLKGNVNGTDMLPDLCRAASISGASIYLLGAKPGVAKAAAQNLRLQYPDLSIAGAEHGYFEAHNCNTVIEKINQSRADILLLAMGSPVQEKWLIEHAPLIHCRTALAVGGLFDFYSGSISRAPLWMRELGMEWLWRLIQEPQDKFYRYVIGNPLFLIRIFILNHANKGS
ncbi:MAG: exopolysaccharide biosynthesis WecB/TagA/CpsF family protein [Paraglaciecola sp.]|jgi:exopolysaccharide biosynthesis WecB/TagA/CpsF family protein